MIQNIIQRYKNFEIKILTTPSLLLALMILLNLSSGIIFGYGIAVGNVTLFQLSQDFQELQATNVTNPLVADFMRGSVQSSYFLGNVIGPVMAPLVVYYTGKISMVILSALCAGTTLGMMFSNSIWMVIVFRGLHGVAVGFAAQITTRHVFELAPVDKRGLTGVIFFLGITTGGFIGSVAFFLNYVPHDWRVMFSISLVWSALLFVASVIIPEVPGRKEETSTPIPYREIWKDVKQVGFMVYVNCVLCIILFQFGGLNMVVSFLPQIVQGLGYTDFYAIALGTCIVAFINLVFSVVATFIVTKFGRKTMVVAGGAIMFVSNLAIAVSSMTLPISISAYFGLFFVVTWIFGNNIGINAVIFFIFNELFPPKISRIGSAFMASLNNFARFLCVMFVLPVQGAIGQPIMFLFSAGVCLAISVLLLAILPETKVSKVVVPTPEEGNPEVNKEEIEMKQDLIDDKD